MKSACPNLPSGDHPYLPSGDIHWPYGQRKTVAGASLRDEESGSRGQNFFKIITRARFATSDPAKRQVLIAARVPDSVLKPFHVSHLIDKLEKEKRREGAKAYYD